MSLENRRLKRAYRFCWNPPCALGATGEIVVVAMPPYWCTRRSPLGPGPGQALLSGARGQCPGKPLFRPQQL